VAQVPLPGGTRKYVIDFRQTFQVIDGIARLDGQPAQMWEVRLRGDRVSFVIVDAADRDDEASLYFEGRVSGNTIEGEVKRGVGGSRTAMHWQAARVGP
jgi:hypothetical protein